MNEPLPKKSGLADSPLFKRVTPLPERVVVDVPPPEQANTRTGEQAHARTDAHPNTRTDAQANRRTPERANTRTGERAIVRESYNVFEDQHTALVRRALENKIQGNPVSISDMVRIAIDEYLKNSS